MSLRINKLAGFDFNRDSGTLTLEGECKLIWSSDRLASSQFLRYLEGDSLTRLTIRINALRTCDLATRELIFNSLRLFSARAHRSVVLISSDDSSLQRQIVVAVRAFIPSVDLAFDSL
mgnify:FL=1